MEKWVLITGVSEGGLGDALTWEFLSRGINVIATALESKQLDYLPSSTNPRLERLQLDVTSSSSISAAVEETKRITSGALHFLINNAGYGYMMPILDSELSALKRNFDVNVFGLLEVTKAFFPLLRAAQGTVVNQASIAGLPGISQPFIGSYSASKTAVVDWSNTMRMEFVPFDVKVVTLFTGDVKTRFWDLEGHVQGSHEGLPTNSPYSLMREHCENMMLGKTNPSKQHSRERWAKAVVGDLLRSKPPVAVRRGSLATIMWVASCLMPSWLLDLMFWHTGRLTTFKTALDAEEQKKMH